MAKEFGVSPLTSRIFMGKSKDIGNGNRQWIGNKEDVTEDVVIAVFEWFMSKASKNNGEYEINFGDEFGTLKYSLKVEE